MKRLILLAALAVCVVTGGAAGQGPPSSDDGNGGLPAFAPPPGGSRADEHAANGMATATIRRADGTLFARQVREQNSMNNRKNRRVRADGQSEGDCGSCRESRILSQLPHRVPKILK